MLTGQNVAGRLPATIPPLIRDCQTHYAFLDATKFATDFGALTYHCGAFSSTVDFQLDAVGLENSYERKMVGMIIPPAGGFTVGCTIPLPKLYYPNGAIGYTPKITIRAHLLMWYSLAQSTPVNVPTYFSILSNNSGLRTVQKDWGIQSSDNPCFREHTIEVFADVDANEIASCLWFTMKLAGLDLLRENHPNLVGAGISVYDTSTYPS